MSPTTSTMGATELESASQGLYDSISACGASTKSCNSHGLHVHSAALILIVFRMQTESSKSSVDVACVMKQCLYVVEDLD